MVKPIHSLYSNSANEAYVERYGRLKRFTYQGIDYTAMFGICFAIDFVNK